MTDETLTREAAQAEITRLIADRDFATKRLSPGAEGEAARLRWASLHRQLVADGSPMTSEDLQKLAADLRRERQGMRRR